MSINESILDPVRILTNITGSNLALEIIPGQVSYLQPDQQILYSDYVDYDTKSPLYNLDRIQQFVSNKVLSDTFEPIQAPVTTINSIDVQSFTAEVRSESSIKITSKSYNQTQDHLEVIPVKNNEDELLIVYYRDIDGMSYSLDKGNTCISISNSNLIYPSEITSAAVQIFESPTNSKPVLTLYIGTLREGIKVFTPGKDSTYRDLVSYDSIDTDATESFDDDPIHPDTGLPILPDYRTEFLFRHYERNLVMSSDSIAGTPYYKYDGKAGDTHSHRPLDFAPVFIFGIFNYPESNGCPLVAYTRTNKDDQPKYRYLIKNLHSIRYDINILNNRVQKNLVSSEISTESYFKSKTGWVVLQENGLVKHDMGIVLPPDVLDIKDTHIDKDSSYSIIKCPYSDVKFENKVISIKSAVSSSGDIPSFTSSVLEDLPMDIRYSNSVMSIFTFFDVLNSYRHLFITEDKSVWSYTTNTWIPFIHKDLSYSSLSTRYFTTGIKSDLTLCDTLAQKASDLSGFRGFSICKLPNTLNFVYGFLSTAIGVIRYYLEVKPGKLDIRVGNTTQPRSVCYEFPQESLSDFTAIYGTGLVLGCNYKTPLKTMYHNNELVYYISSMTASKTQIEVASRSNYLVKNQTESRFVSGNMTQGITYLPTDQIVELFIQRAPDLELALKHQISDCLVTPNGIPVFCTVKTSTDPDEPLFKPIFDRDLYLYLCQSFGKYLHTAIKIDSTLTKTISSFNYTLYGSTIIHTPITARLFEPPTQVYIYNPADFE